MVRSYHIQVNEQTMSQYDVFFKNIEDILLKHLPLWDERGLNFERV